MKRKGSFFFLDVSNLDTGDPGEPPTRNVSNLDTAGSWELPAGNVSNLDTGNPGEPPARNVSKLDTRDPGSCRSKMCPTWTPGILGAAGRKCVQFGYIGLKEPPGFLSATLSISFSASL